MQSLSPLSDAVTARQSGLVGFFMALCRERSLFMLCSSSCYARFGTTALEGSGVSRFASAIPLTLMYHAVPFGQQWAPFIKASFKLACAVKWQNSACCAKVHQTRQTKHFHLIYSLTTYKNCLPGFKHKSKDFFRSVWVWGLYWLIPHKYGGRLFGIAHRPSPLPGVLW